MTADEVAFSGSSLNQHLGHGINERVSVDFDCRTQLKSFNTAWDPEALVERNCATSSLFRNSFVLPHDGRLLDRRVCVPVFYEHAAEKHVFVFCPV